MKQLLIFFFLCFFILCSAGAQGITADYLLDSSRSLLNKDRKGAQLILKKLSKRDDLNAIQKSQLFNSLGHVHFYESEYDSSVYYYKKSLEIALSQNDTLRIISRMTNIGLVYRKKGWYEESLNQYLLALSLFAEDKLDKEYAGLHNSVGTVYHLIKDYEMAKDHYQNALEVYLLFGDSSRISKAYNNIGIAFFETGALEKGRKSYQASLNYNLSNHNAAKNLGEYYVLVEKEDSAMIFLDISWKLREESKDTIGLAAILNQYAILAKNEKRWFEADSLLQQSEILLRKVPDGNKLMENMQLQKVIALQFQQFKTALIADSVMDSINHHLFQEERLKVNKSFLKSVETEKDQLDSQRLLAEKQTQIVSQSAKLRLYIIVGMAVVVLIVIALVWLIWRSRNKVQQLNLSVEKQNQTITILAQEASHQTKNGLQLLSALMRLKSSRSSNAGVKEALHEAAEQLDVMNSIYKKLLSEQLETKNLSVSDKIDLSEYLLEVLKGAFGEIDEQAVKHYALECGPTLVNLKVAGFIGLIINELSTNFRKYAFTKHEKFTVSISKSSLQLTIHICDDGKGYDTSIDQTGFGTVMVRSLVADLDGTLEIVSNEQGTRHEIQIPI